MVFNMIIGIDASNISSGGGLAHLKDFLAHLQYEKHCIDKIVVFGTPATLTKLPNSHYIEKVRPLFLSANNNLLRFVWQFLFFSKAAKQRGCNILFIPGGIFFGRFRPYVSMSQNLLPFSPSDIHRYAFSVRYFKFHIMRHLQTYTMRRAAGVIFLTNYARYIVCTMFPGIVDNSVVVNHAISGDFSQEPRKQLNIDFYNLDKPFKIIYPSTIDEYKCQDIVLSAAKALRHAGFPINLQFCGSSYLPSLRKLEQLIGCFDPNNEWCEYIGEKSNEELRLALLEADLAVFASSCETFGIVLLEAMALGLPIVCSSQGSMIEVLGDRGVYFKSGDYSELGQKLKSVIDSPSKRIEIANYAYERSKLFNLNVCAESTLEFLFASYEKYQNEIITRSRNV